MTDEELIIKLIEQINFHEKKIKEIKVKIAEIHKKLVNK